MPLNHTETHAREVSRFPSFSVITPSFNQGDYIETTVRSVIAQNYSSFEHIVIDGGSTDGTVRILEKYPHLKWVSERDDGQADALNKGFMMASGDIVAWLNSDDWYLEGAFDRVAEVFQSNPDVKIVLGDCVWFYEESGRSMLVQNKSKTFEDIIRYWDDWIIPTQPSVFFRRELLAEFGLLDTHLAMAMDYELWLRITQKFSFYHIPLPLSGYRFHSDSKSGTSQNWSHFFPEWFLAYKRHKSASQRLPKGMLISAAIPLCSELAYSDCGHVGSINQAIAAIQANIVLDMEIIVVTDISDAEGFIGTGGCIPVRFVCVSKLTTALFIETALVEARGFACHLVDLLQPVSERWYVPLLDHLLDNPPASSATDRRRPAGFHPFLSSDTPFGTASLYVTEAARSTIKDVAPVADSKPKVSVVIPTFNRSDILIRCLQHLAGQTLLPASFEVVVCDDGSTDGTFDLVHSFPAPFSLTYLRQENRGPAAARNMGIGKARGEYVLFLNDDALLHPRALDIHLEEHRRLANPKAAVLGVFSMHSEFTDTARPIGYCMDHSDFIFDYYSMLPGNAYGHDKFYTCNISLRRDFIAAGELFDPAFVCLAGGEDIEYGYRLQQRGATISYRPDCVALHAHSITPGALGKMFITRGKGGVLHFLRHNHLPHHYARMTPADAERFMHAHARLEPSVQMLGETMLRIDRLNFRDLGHPLPMTQQIGSFNFMSLWESSGEKLEVIIDALQQHLGFLYDKLVNDDAMPVLQEAALQLIPALNFIKWYYDTVGVVSSEHLLSVMESDRKAGRHGSAALAKPYLANRRDLCAADSEPHRQKRALPAWQAKENILDWIPSPFWEAEKAGLSDHFTHYREHFQLRMQDGNIAAIRHLAIVNGIFDASKGQAPPELAGMGFYSLLRLLEEQPFQKDLAAFALQLVGIGKGRDPGFAQMLDQVKQFEPGQTDKTRVRDHLANFEYEQAERLLDDLDRRFPGDPEVLWESTCRRLESGADCELTLKRREADFRGTPFEWWWHWTLGASRFRRGEFEAALEPLEASLRARTNSHTANLLAESLYRLGERDGSLSLWRESLRHDPIQTHLYLKMHDCLTGFDRLTQDNLAAEKICVLIYCWNKRDVLKTTLERLAESDLGSSQILMLDNHSTDGTAEFMDGAQALFPHNPCRVIHLPTNVGAPAARNWLMAQPEARQADYVAFLDDDVDVPVDWLGRLVATLKAFPKAGVAGSRIVEPLLLPTLQYGGVFLDVASQESLRVTSKHGNEPDYGQLNYVRSCVSVMGCCHLFRNQALYDVGEFDVRFSPTQVDDMEHDIRTVLKGYEVIYNGHNRVVHHQKTGKQAILNRAAKGNVEANVHKMITKHPVEETRRIKLETEARDREYLRQKIGELRSAGLLDGVREVPFGIV